MERDDGMLVSKRWLEFADDKLNKSDAPTPTKTNAPSSRFYDVRPCKLTSDWTSENGVGVATANLIINSQESDVSIKIYDATGDAEEKGVDSGAFCYAVYRGRWEVLASFASNGGGGDKILYGTTTALITGYANPRYTVRANDGGDYEVELNVFNSVLLNLGCNVVFCVPSNGATPWIINAETV